MSSADEIINETKQEAKPSDLSLHDEPKNKAEGGASSSVRTEFIIGY